MKIRGNTGEDLHELERKAVAGDEGAQVQLFLARVRAGTITKEEVDRLAVGCDRLALKALGEACGDRAVLRVAGAKKRFTSNDAADVVEAYYLANGYARDQRSSAGSLLSPDGKTKITFAARVWRRFGGGRGNWYMVDSGSLPKTAEVLVAKARSRVHKDQGALAKLKEKRTKAATAAGKRKQKASAAGLVLRMAVVEAARQLTPGDRREIMLTREGAQRYSRMLEDLIEKVSPPDGATEESIDARLSIEHPPVPPRAGTYRVREVSVHYSGQHSWVDDGLKRPVRVWSAATGKLGVEIGSMPVDPIGMTMSKLALARSFSLDQSKHDGLVGTIRVLEEQGLWLGYLFLIVTSPRRAGAGTRYLRAWCRLLQAYGAEPRWVAQAVGPEGNAWLAELAKRGEVEIGARDRSDLVVECLAPAASVRTNPDEGLRRLERRAAMGDLEAQAALEVARRRVDPLAVQLEEAERQAAFAQTRGMPGLLFPYARRWRDLFAEEAVALTTSAGGLSKPPAGWAIPLPGEETAYGRRGPRTTHFTSAIGPWCSFPHGVGLRSLWVRPASDEVAARIRANSFPGGINDRLHFEVVLRSGEDQGVSDTILITTKNSQIIGGRWLAIMPALEIPRIAYEPEVGPGG